jgi:membrane-associated protein
MLNFLMACIHLDPMAMIRTGSYLGLASLVFAESGLLIGIFLPGDSLLFTAGLLAGSGYLDIGTLIFVVVVSAILGDSVGYWFGANVGTNFFKRKDSTFFKQEYLKRTERFYQKYGGRAVVLARFIPIVRTIAPILAGIGSMKYRVFLAYNVLGGLLWGAGILLISFFVGSALPNAEKYILPISFIIIVVSFLPIFFNLSRGKSGV